MDDKTIVDLYWQRSEQAISETDRKYGTYCRSIARNIVNAEEDAQECVNDTYLAAWNAMPTHRPSLLSAFLGKLARRISLDRWRRLSARKRGGGETTLALDELGEVASETAEAETILIRRETVAALNRFLDALPQTERQVFLSRYFYLDPVGEIAENFHFSQAKTASMLRRTRLKLKAQMEKEGYL